jgi:hypothetical protein
VRKLKTAFFVSLLLGVGGCADYLPQGTFLDAHNLARPEIQSAFDRLSIYDSLLVSIVFPTRSSNSEQASLSLKITNVFAQRNPYTICKSYTLRRDRMTRAEEGTVCRDAVNTENKWVAHASLYVLTKTAG